LRSSSDPTPQVKGRFVAVNKLSIGPDDQILIWRRSRFCGSPLAFHIKIIILVNRSESTIDIVSKGSGVVENVNQISRFSEGNSKFSDG
jgi:hypothetical protein